ncbi:MAG: hypothetical protein ABSD20_17900 [Terriglobales bacterium]|jgi:hypothetical protein
MSPFLVASFLVLALVCTAHGQSYQPQTQAGPAPGFIAYQALFIKVVLLETRAAQEDATRGAGNSMSVALRSQIPNETGLTDADYAALVAIAQDYASQKAAYYSARNAILKAVYAQQAAGGKATWDQTVQLSNLFQQYIAMVDNHINQRASKLSAAGAQAVANYVQATVAKKTWWAK